MFKKKLNDFLFILMNYVLKVVTVIIIYGTCRGDELHKISIDHIENTPKQRVELKDFFIMNNLFDI